MTKSTRRLWVLIGGVAILALTLAAVGPVFAQGGTTGGSGQSGSSVALGATDTLGDLVSRYNLSGSDLREFFSLNTGLVVDAGQTVTFPEGVNVNLGGNQGQGTTNGTGSTGGTTGGTNTQTTPTATGAATGGTDTQATPTVAGGVGATTGDVQPTGVVNESGKGTYVTQKGDTLGTLLTAMGFSSSDQGTSSTNSGTTAGGGNTGTTGVGNGTTGGNTAGTAGTSGDTAQATATTGSTTGGTTAQATATTTGGTGGTTGGDTTQATATTTDSTGGAGSTSGNAGQSNITDEQLQSFVTLNSDLDFADDPAQTVMLPASIPQTGSNQGQGAATATPGTGATVEAGSPTATVQGNQGQTGQGQSTYTVQSGDTLEDIARRNNVTLAQLVAANPNLLTAGQTINIPSGKAGIPQTGGAGQGTGTGTQGQGGTGGAGGVSQQGGTVARCGEAPKAPAGYGWYRMQSGDTLASLSQRFGVETSEILSLNAGRGIFPGSVILLPGVEAPGQWNVEALRAPCASGENSNGK